MMNNNDSEFIVTALKKLSDKRRLVYINDEPAFALYTGEIRKLEIVENSAMDQKTYNSIVDELLTKRAKLRAMSLLKSKDYAENELFRKLQSGYYPVKVIEHAIDYVKQYGYINDYRYAQNYIAFQSDNKSKKQIEQFLMNKGIAKTVIEEVCVEYYQENEDAELAVLIRQMQKKCAKYDQFTYEERQKVMSSFYRKGFSIDTVKKALDIVADQRYNN
jgi:regulatory protein